MDRRNNLLILFFAGVVIVSLAGFFNSYIRFLPDTAKFPLVIHIHFAAFLCWFAMIIVQPVLIRQKKYALHRRLGKISYFIAPVLVVTILILVKHQAARALPVSQNNASVAAFIGLLDAVSFSAYYIIAMINRRNVRWHVAFLVAATLVTLNPGMSRLLNQLKPGLGLSAAIRMPFVISIPVIIVEKLRYKRPLLRSPYFLFVVLWVVALTLLVVIPHTGWWRAALLRALG